MSRAGYQQAMRRSVGFLATSILLAAGAPPAQAIVGGGPAAPGEYPYVANIVIADAAGCTGSLVAPRWVITAGHCSSVLGPAGVPTQFALPASSFTVTLGTVRSNGKADSTKAVEKHAVSSVHVDPNYAATNGTGSDVALLELAEPSKLAPVLIAGPDEGSIWEPGDELTIAGFGVTEEDGDAPDTLQETVVPRIGDAKCADAYDDTTPVVGNAFDPATAICAGLTKGGRDTCQGDSGGPILAPLPVGGMRLVGATSYGEGCARKNRPGVYARLAEGSVKAFVSDFVPEAYAPAGAPQPAPETCAGEPGLRIRIRGANVRRITVFIDGRRVLRRKRAGRINLARRLPGAGTAEAKIVVKRAGGKRRVIRRTYTDCARA